MNILWQPIYSVERSGVPEVTISGAIAVVEGNGKVETLPEPILTLGDTSTDLWTRSLLKPWQLLDHYDAIKTNYPTLKPEHIAMMMASHSAEHVHQDLLKELMQIGGVTEDMLQCPPAFPQSAELRREMKEQGAPARRLFHNCSGKHFGYLMAIKAQHGDVAHYRDVEAKHFVPLKKLLAYVLRRDRDLPVTTDGCQLPNYAVSIYEMATLYQGLANLRNAKPSGDADIDRMLHAYPEIFDLMRHYPLLISGTDRLDVKIMTGGLSLHGNPPIVAKEGADGLLAIGVSATKQYPNGLGIVIKVSSGFDKQEMELIAGEVLAQLGLRDADSYVPAQPKGARSDHIQTTFHFKLRLKQHA